MQVPCCPQRQEAQLLHLRSDRFFFQKSLQSQTYPIVRIWTARATARGPHLCGDLYDVIGRLEVGVGTSSWCWGLMGLPKFDKLKFDNFPQNLKLEVTFWHWASNLTLEVIFGGSRWLICNHMAFHWSLWFSSALWWNNLDSYSDNIHGNFWKIPFKADFTHLRVISKPLVTMWAIVIWIWPCEPKKSSGLLK